VIGSRQAVLGQAWGGFSHSIGFALSENYEDMKKHATMRGAGVPRCNDVPDTFNVLFHETYRENGPHGSTGCAEGFQSAGHVSILNAIADAVGVRVATLPVTPEKLKAAMTAKAAGVPYGQEPWDLGCSLYERLAFLKARHAGKGKG
jgi:aldehyde oxidoreductase